MACNSEFIEFVCSQIADAGEIRFRKMFGDYVIYVNEKPVITACDGICYVKKHPSIQSLMENAECGHPYEGAKEHYILHLASRPCVAGYSCFVEDVAFFQRQGLSKNALKRFKYG